LAGQKLAGGGGEVNKKIRDDQQHCEQ